MIMSTFSYLPSAACAVPRRKCLVDISNGSMTAYYVPISSICQIFPLLFLHTGRHSLHVLHHFLLFRLVDILAVYDIWT